MLQNAYQWCAVIGWPVGAQHSSCCLVLWTRGCVLLCFIRPILGNPNIITASFLATQLRLSHDPRSPKSQPHPVPPQIAWGVQILTLHLDYVAGCTGPLVFLFEQTYNYYVDNQGLVPWRLCRLGRSIVRLAS